MIPAAFEHHAPAGLEEAIGLLTRYGDAAKVLAGGHSLLPMMKLRLATPEHLIDLNNISALKGIRDDGDFIVIGAMTSEAELIASPILTSKCPLLPEAARQIADPQVRNCGTIGGDIAHADPGNDHPAIMIAAGAEFLLAGPKGERSVPADGFFIDMFATQLAADEILTAIRIPAIGPHTGYAYCKLKRKTGDYATAATAVQLRLDGTRCKQIAIALTNAAVTALRVREAEALLAGQAIDDGLIEQAAEKAMAICDPAEDLRGDRDYKTAMVGEMTRRALRLALDRARGA